ncbi:portal protein [Streptomyces phage Ibantik]|uniref:Portal protein n=1 Tax=Streptomyces phage Ibantik TaxID=2182397 RepID=A0A2U8UP91_9CAUD|nr:portal protein [Streptomyces phage Ibantik]AWN05291.1 portal protein [Streptomyces phage Ibantik]
MTTAPYNSDGSAAAGIFSSPQTPIEWVNWLYSKLLRNKQTFMKYQAYYEGQHQKLVFSQARYHNQYGHIFAQWSDNFSGLIIDSVNERMAIDGFRMTEEDTEADKDARSIWQRNYMDSESNTGNREALINGVSYAIVWGDSDGEPVISVESPLEVVVEYKPGSRRELLAGAKFYKDAWGKEYGTLFLPNEVYQFDMNGLAAQALGSPAPNPMGEVPIVPLMGRTRLVGDPVSDLQPVIPIQNAINKVTADALVASEYAAWPQRWVTGLEIQEDENGRPVEPWDPGISKILQSDAPESKFGQFEAADLGNYVTLVDMLVQHLAAVTRIPFSYMLANKSAAPSGEANATAEAGLIAKTRDSMTHLGEGWERVMRLAFKVKGKHTDEMFSAEIIWRDPENRTEAQHMDALIKQKELGVPRDELLSAAGYTPAQIERFREMRIQDAKDEAEIQKHLPKPEAPAGPDGKPVARPGDKAAAMAAKAPQGNAGNQARKQKDPSAAK